MNNQLVRKRITARLNGKMGVENEDDTDNKDITNPHPKDDEEDLVMARPGNISTQSGKAQLMHGGLVLKTPTSIWTLTLMSSGLNDEVLRVLNGKQVTFTLNELNMGRTDF